MESATTRGRQPASRTVSPKTQTRRPSASRALAPMSADCHPGRSTRATRVLSSATVTGGRAAGSGGAGQEGVRVLAGPAWPAALLCGRPGVAVEHAVRVPRAIATAAPTTTTSLLFSAAPTAPFSSGATGPWRWRSVA